MKEIANITNKCDNKVETFQKLQEEKWFTNLDNNEQLKIISYCINSISGLI